MMENTVLPGGSLCQEPDDFSAEIGEIIWSPAGDQTPIPDNRLIQVFCSGVDQVIPDGAQAGQSTTFNETGRN